MAASPRPTGDGVPRDAVFFRPGPTRTDGGRAILLRARPEVDEARELFLGVVAHDMRSPLGASMQAARYLKGLSGLDDRGSEAIAALRMSHPEATLTLEAAGDLRGEWDAAALDRVLVNPVENAIKHGEANAPVEVGLQGTPDEVELTVSNSGEPIPAERGTRIFEPMTAWTHGAGPGTGGSKSYGLGLYIAREIVSGHGGEIGVESNRIAGTRFRVRLPRYPRRR